MSVKNNDVVIFLSLSIIHSLSVMRDHAAFVRLPSRLPAGFAENVAGYAEEKRQIRYQQASENSREATSSMRNVALAVPRPI